MFVARGPPPGYYDETVVLDDPDLIDALHLNCSDEDCDRFLAGVPHEHLRNLGSPYQPPGTWVCKELRDKDSWFKKWSPDWKAAKLTDPFSKKTLAELEATFLIDRTEMGVVMADESIILPDSSLLPGEQLTLVVPLNGMSDKRVVEYIGKLALEAVHTRRNSRVC